MLAFGRVRIVIFGFVALAVLLALPVTLDVSSARAKPIEQEHYSGTDSGEFDCNGLITLHFENEFSGVFKLKQGRRGDPTPYLFDNYQYRVVYTAVPDTGRWFTIEGNGLYKDLRITQVEGTIYTFEAIETGRPATVRDQDGNVVFRDRGRLHVRFVVDTKGDSDLENDVFIEGSFELLAVNGPHPWFLTDGCQWASDYLQG